MLKYNKELEDIFIKNNIPYRNNIKINKLQKEIDNFNRIFYLSLAGYKKDYKLYDYFRQRYLSNAFLRTDIFKSM